MAAGRTQPRLYPGPGTQAHLPAAGREAHSPVSPLAFIGRVFSTSRGLAQECGTIHPGGRSCHQWICQEGRRAPLTSPPQACLDSPGGYITGPWGQHEQSQPGLWGSMGSLHPMQSPRGAATTLTKASHPSELLLRPGAPSCQGWSGTPSYSPQ